MNFKIIVVILTLLLIAGALILYQFVYNDESSSNKVEETLQTTEVDEVATTSDQTVKAVPVDTDYIETTSWDDFYQELSRREEAFGEEYWPITFSYYNEIPQDLDEDDVIKFKSYLKGYEQAQLNVQSLLVSASTSYPLYEKCIHSKTDLYVTYDDLLKELKTYALISERFNKANIIENESRVVEDTYNENVATYSRGEAIDALEKIVVLTEESTQLLTNTEGLTFKGFAKIANPFNNYKGILQTEIGSLKTDEQARPTAIDFFALKDNELAKLAINPIDEYDEWLKTIPAAMKALTEKNLQAEAVCEG